MTHDDKTYTAYPTGTAGLWGVKINGVKHPDVYETEGAAQRGAEQIAIRS